MTNSNPAGRTLVDFFSEFADRESEFVVYDDGFRRWSYSYRQIAQSAQAFAVKLRAAEIAKGDKILIWSENRPEWLAAFWGAVWCGVIVVPVDYRFSAEAMRNVARAVRPRAIVVGEEVEAAALGDSPPVWRLAEIDLSAHSASLRISPAAIAPDDAVELVFTSGSTAAPKGVIITHRNIVADLAPIEREVAKYRRLVRILRPLRFLDLMPLSHMFGQALATFFPPMLPGAAVFTRSYAARDVIRQIRACRVAFMVGAPKMLELLRQFVLKQFPELAQIGGDDSPWFVRRLRYRSIHRLFGIKFIGFVVGGASLERGLERFWRQLGFMVVQGYGLTETAPIVSFNHPFHLKPHTVGKPLDGVELRIAPDGEILVRGDIVTPGYFNAPAAASEAFADGWFHTGDIGAIDADGYLAIRGRKKELIVTPEGLKVFPEDVELALNRIPGVRDSAAVGRERVHAVLVLDPGVNAEEIVRRANAALEDHQRIREVSVWTNGELPRTEGAGKLMRAAIQRWVDGGAPPAASSPSGEIAAILRKYAPARRIDDETTLDDLGLTSLEQVELMVDLEERFNLAVDESALSGAIRVGDLAARIAGAAPPTEDAGIADWNRRAPARLLRRILLGAIVIPLTRRAARIRVSGLDRIESLKGPLIFAANHQSHLDAPVILAALPRRWRYRIAPAMWREFFDAHFHPEGRSRARRAASAAALYLAMLVFNAFPISQEEIGLRGSLRHIGDLVSDGWSILIFPEGERSTTGDVEAFHAGVGMIGARMRVAVAPVRLRGVDRVLPRGARWIRRGAVEVAFGDPIELSGDDYAALARRVEGAVRAL